MAKSLRVRKPKSNNHYVDNKKLLEVLVEYRKNNLLSIENGTEPPRIPEYVGYCLLQIANHLSTKFNFRSYTFKEEMISDGIETCIKYMYNFDPEKSSNPFSYFTQIIYFAFLNRIKREKMQLYIKQKSLQNVYFEGLLADQVISGEHAVNVDLDNPYMNDLVESIETKRAEVKEAKQKEPVRVEKFFEDEPTKRT
jgi:hypothetical protein